MVNVWRRPSRSKRMSAKIGPCSLTSPQRTFEWASTFRPLSGAKWRGWRDSYLCRRLRKNTKSEQQRWDGVKREREWERDEIALSLVYSYLCKLLFSGLYIYKVYKLLIISWLLISPGSCLCFRLWSADDDRSPSLWKDHVGWETLQRQPREKIHHPWH